MNKVVNFKFLKNKTYEYQNYQADTLVMTLKSGIKMRVWCNPQGELNCGTVSWKEGLQPSMNNDKPDDFDVAEKFAMKYFNR